jgi:hypothetical protein
MLELVDCIEEWLSVDILEYSKWGLPAAGPPTSRSADLLIEGSLEGYLV